MKEAACYMDKESDPRCRHSVAEKTRTGCRRTEELSTRLQPDIRI